MNKTLTWVVVGLLVVIGAIVVLTKKPSSLDNGTNNDGAGAMGRVVFSVTDAAVNMETINEITMEVSKVEMHSSEKGWVTASTDSESFDLLALNASGTSEVLADVEVPEGMYDQVRLMIDGVVVETKAGAKKTAKLPSGELKIMATVVVDSENTASINLDFLADKSLHVTGNGQYIFAPVVNVESKSEALVNVGANGVVTITGGNVISENSVGMDLDGSVKANFQLDTKQKLRIGSDNKIEIDVSGILK